MTRAHCEAILEKMHFGELMICAFRHFKMVEIAVETNKRNLGSENRSTLNTMNSMARLLNPHGMSSQAGQLQWETA